MRKEKGSAEIIVLAGALILFIGFSLKDMFKRSPFNYNKKIAGEEILIPANLSTVSIEKVEIKPLSDGKIAVSARVFSVSKEGAKIPVKAFVNIVKEGKILQTEEMEDMGGRNFYKEMQLEEQGIHTVFLSAEDKNRSSAFEMPSKNELKDNFLVKICGDNLPAENKDLDILQCEFSHDENSFYFRLLSKGQISHGKPSEPNFYSLLVLDQKDDADPEKASFFFYCPLRKIRRKADAFHVYSDLKNSLWKRPLSPKGANLTFQISNGELSFSFPRTLLKHNEVFKLFFLTASIIDTRQFRRLPADFTPFISIYPHSHTIEIQ